MNCSNLLTEQCILTDLSLPVFLTLSALPKAFFLMNSSCWYVVRMSPLQDLVVMLNTFNTLLGSARACETVYCIKIRFNSV